MPTVVVFEWDRVDLNTIFSIDGSILDCFAGFKFEAADQEIWTRDRIEIGCCEINGSANVDGIASHETVWSLACRY